MVVNVDIQLSGNGDVRLWAVCLTVWSYGRPAEFLMKQHWEHFGAKL